VRLWILSLLVLVSAFISGARAEPTSIRCADEFNNQAHFFTYDLQARRLMFESPVGNIHPGEILADNDEKLEFVIHAIGKILLSYDRKREVVYWPGLFALELRKEASHYRCTTVPDRTVLAQFSQSPGNTDLRRQDPNDVFSLRCIGPGADHYFTFDRSSKVVVFEVQNDAISSGEITSISDNDVKFTIGSRDRYNLIWHEKAQILTILGVPPDRTRVTQTEECTPIKARSVMELYDRMQRRNYPASR
jgi:hypothetical protein